MAEVLRVVSSGPCATVQDLGRTGWMKYGLPPSGALDRESFCMANLIAGNSAGSPGIELTMGGFEAQVLRRTVLSCTGADAEITLDGEQRQMWEAFEAFPDQVLRVSAPNSGVRVYVAVMGGIDVPRIGKSASTYVRGKLGGLHGRPFREGDMISVSRAGRGRLDDMGAYAVDPRRLAWTREALRAVFDAESAGRANRIRVVIGPQDDCFTLCGLSSFLDSEYTLTAQCDRMGMRFDGPPIERLEGADIISDGMPAGAVQVPADGKPIVMMADRQTTGGYPKIACVIREDQSVLAQLRPGARVQFCGIPVQKANALARTPPWERESEACRGCTTTHGASSCMEAQSHDPMCAETDGGPHDGRLLTMRVNGVDYTVVIREIT
ncbi:MAG: biotin-dependent carboxyltransferase family protein [Clostridia bacterium]|nr:biotin-dependent carboxyltransferase family protein [Clostridia bacterium]